MEDSLLNVDKLTVSYGDINVLREISFSIEKSSIYAVLCPNNCGKTTLIKAISGIISTSSGSVIVDGTTLSKEEIDEYILKISTILEDINDQFICNTVYDEIAYPLINLDYEKDEIEKKIEEISHITKISTILWKKVRKLSYFEKIKVLLTASIVSQPKVLLVDDIFRFLSSNEKENIHNILDRINKLLDITILFTTSDIEDVIGINKIILLNGGREIEINSYDNLIKKDNELAKMGFHIPLMIDLSRKLQFYNLVDDIYYDRDKVVDKLWN